MNHSVGRLLGIAIITATSLVPVESRAELPTLHLDVHSQPIIVAPVAAEKVPPPQSPQTIAASKFHHINQHEIQVAQLARQRATVPAVQNYAQMLLDDHRATDRKLEAIAKEMNLDLGAVLFDEAEREMMDHLQSLKGQAFDKEFVSQMKLGHEKAIAEMKETRSGLESGALADLISKTLPQLEAHMKEAVQLEGTLPNTASVGTNNSPDAPGE